MTKTKKRKRKKEGERKPKQIAFKTIKARKLKFEL